jgi:tRNA threonylcarbamoyl adenosine modification protein (Sua5/YciO/YrdC/YwlC family)
MASELERAVEVIARGGIVGLATDTVPGLAVRPGDPAATGRVFTLKARPKDMVLPVLVATTEEAGRIGVLDERARRLASCWPGGLTLIVPRTQMSRTWDLGSVTTTIGIRMPDHPLALALLERTGPLAVTSANRSGQPPVATREELTALIAGIPADVSRAVLWPDPDGRRGASSEHGMGLRAASSVVDLSHGPARLVRAGAVPASEIAGFLGMQEPLLDSGLP